MNPRTKRKTTKKRRAKRTKKHAFRGYLLIFILALIVGASTYFLLNHFYGKIDEKYSKQAIDKIEKFFDKKKQDDNKSLVSKNEQSLKTKQEQNVKEARIKQEQNISKPELKPKSTLKDYNLTSDEESVVKSIIKSMDRNDTNLTDQETVLVEQNLTKADTRISIEIVEQNKTKQEKKDDKNQTKKAKIEDKRPLSGKPKLVIIIDDIAYKHQVDAIKSINLKITPSIFPATKHHPDTPKLAKMFKFYMIHLPMQAHGYKKEEIGTLRTNDSYDKILKRIRDIKNDFPDVKYINNHTGSKFTSDFDAMNRLMRVVKSENLVFVDSKTIADSKVEQVASKHGMPYIARDVFLDHEDSKASIRKQLKYAVGLAKRNSRAIAIGHPYKNTIEVLKNSSDILKDVEVVYLKDIL